MSNAVPAMTGPVVHDPKCLLACLLRMHVANEAVVFWNKSREFKIMLRNDPEDAATISFEVCIVAEDGDDQVSRVLELEYDGYFDSDAFVVESYAYGMEAAVKQPDTLRDSCTKLNELYAYTVCRCGAYFIKDGAGMCLFCQLSSDAIDATRHFCAICHDSSIVQHMVSQTCCKQMLHRACVAAWQAKSSSTACPLCRQEAPAPAQMESQ